MDPISLIGDRIILRDLNVDEALQHYKWFWESNPETMTCRPFKRKTEAEYVAHMQEHFQKRDVTFLAICRREDDVFLGRLTLFDLNESNGAIEIGYMIGPPFRRKGYAREAVGLSLKYLFDTLKLKRVVAQTGSFNQASIALLESLGFKQEGRLRQHHLYNGDLHDDLLFGLLASEYKR